MRNPLTTEALIDWLEKQNPTEEYCWWDPESCLLGRYAASLGLSYNDMPHALRWEYWIAFPNPHTFGRALKRARKLVASS